MKFSFSAISGKVVHRIIHEDITTCVQQVAAAYIAHGARQSVNPDSYFLLRPDRPKDRIIALPAYLGDDFNVSGIKWIASYPDNIQHGFPRASAVLILNNADTGYPFACLEASIISAARTAGSAVLAAQWMNAGVRKVRTLGLVGNGLIARYIYTFFLEMGWEVEQVLLYDQAPSEAERFANSVCRKAAHQQVTVVPDLPSLMRNSELIVLATVAPRPHIIDSSLLAHNPLVLNISLRDLAPELLLQSYNIVDDIEHVMKANTSPHLAEQLTGSRSFVTGTLCELMQGQCRVERTRPVVFSPFGMGVLDLAVGKWVYEQAVAAGEDSRISDFFFEMTR
jgi:N-[(2S)-2-amino-2-carboxyethyl]-L-glutamate dehydrogenase